MSKPEDQLAEVRKRLALVPHGSLAALAVEAGVSMRTLQYIATKDAHYCTVHKIYTALEKRAAKLRKVKVEVL